MPPCFAGESAPARLTVESFRLTAPPVAGMVESSFRDVRMLGGTVGTFHCAVDNFRGAAPAGFGIAKAFYHTVNSAHGTARAFYGAVKVPRDAVKPSGGMVK